MSLIELQEQTSHRIKEIEQIRKDALNVVHLNVMDGLCAYVKDHGKPLFVLIRGYTPSFNDGDPCEHYQESMVDSAIYDYGLEEDGSECTLEFMDDNWGITDNQLVEMIGQQNKDYSKSQLIDIQNVFDTAEDAIVAKSRHGTDFHMVYWFNPDGTYIRHETEYYCDH